MNNFKKKILAGLLGGALILTSSAVMANPPEMQEPNEDWQAEAAANIGGWAKYLSEKYGVDSAQVEQALNNGVHVDDAHNAAILAKLSGKSFSDVLAMKVDWPQVAEKLGVTHEQIEEFFKQEHDEYFAQQAGIDVKTLRNLLNEGYDLRDIGIAGKIAKASGKNIKTVLEKRKINNTWKEVAQSFGVDIKKIMPHPPGHHHGR